MKNCFERCALGIACSHRASSTTVIHKTNSKKRRIKSENPIPSRGPGGRLFFIVMALACSSSGGDDKTPSNTEDSSLIPITHRSTISLAAQNGQSLVAIDAKQYLPAYNGGNYNQAISQVSKFVHNITPFEIGQYEVTYELWYTVRVWAEANGYSFANLGREGSAGTDGVSPTEVGKLEPVTMVNWRDVIVWCNAYSEMARLTPCYYTDNTLGTVLKTSSNETTISAANGDIPSDCVNWNANGYRLPTEGEWQYAASCAGFYAYRYASGAATQYDDRTDACSYEGDVWTSSPNGVPDNKDANDAVSVYGHLMTSTGGWSATGVTKTAQVGSKRANPYNLYDMSGNVSEFCWDWFGSDPAGPVSDYNGELSGTLRIAKGGSCSDLSIVIALGPVSAPEPYTKLNSMGFRVARCP